MEENVEISYNNSKYVLVDSAQIDGEEIYHFVSYKMIDFLIDEENYIIDRNKFPVFSLFCIKENGEFIPIENKKKEKQLLEEFGMIPDPIIPIIDVITAIGRKCIIWSYYGNKLKKSNL